MTVIDTESFILPTCPGVIKQIKDCCFEISSSMTRIEAEKDLIKEAISALAEDTEIPKKYIAKVSRLYHKQNKDAVEAEQGSANDLYDRIYPQDRADTDD